MEMILRRSGSWSVINGKTTRPDDKTAATWDSLSEDGLTAIGLSIEQSQTSYIRDCTTGPQAWDALAAIYQRNARSTRINLKRQFYTYVHDTSQPIRDYVTGITTLVTKLKAIGVTISDEDVTDVLIYALAPEYSAVATSLMQSSTTLTVAFITGALVDAEAQMQKDKSEPPVSVFVAKNTTTRRRRPDTPSPDPSSTSSSNSDTGCYRCGKPGHIARYCLAPAPLAVQPATTSPNLSANIAQVQFETLQLF